MELSEINDCINRGHLALAHLGLCLRKHTDEAAVKAATLRLRAIVASLMDMSGAAAEDTHTELPMDLEPEFLATADQPPPSPDEPTTLYKVWVEIERQDVMTDTYASGIEGIGIEPKCAGTYTSLRLALEQVISLQGVYGGMQLFEHDYRELAQADETEHLLASPSTEPELGSVCPGCEIECVGTMCPESPLYTENAPDDEPVDATPDMDEDDDFLADED